MSLVEKRWVPWEGGTLPLSDSPIKKYLKEVPAWIIIDGKKISRGFKFNSFSQAMFFVNKVADLAEAEGHHPDIHIFYNKVSLELSTHAIGGLSENDFILAAKIDRL